jgi:hypothetical protein
MYFVQLLNKFFEARELLFLTPRCLVHSKHTNTSQTEYSQWFEHYKEHNNTPEFPEVPALQEGKAWY